MDNKKVDNIRLLGKLPDDLISTLNTFKNISQDDWLKYNKVKPNRFGVFKNTTEHIVFRFVNDIEKPKSGYFNYNVFDEYESYLQKIMDYVKTLYSYKNSEYSRIMLAKLYTGCEIDKHVDGNESAVEPHKIHIPIVTHDNCIFYCDDESINMKENYIYEVDNQKMHGVINSSDVDRIHLIIELYEV